MLDEGDDLFYIRARYYDSEQQRFVGKDAKAGNDREGQSLNRYVYGLNNPVRLIDISGFLPSETIDNTNNNNQTNINNLSKPLDRRVIFDQIKLELGSVSHKEIQSR